MGCSTSLIDFHALRHLLVSDSQFRRLTDLRSQACRELAYATLSRNRP